MRTTRRNFLSTTAAAGAGAAALPLLVQQADSSVGPRPSTLDSRLSEAAAKPILDLKGLKDPVIIESIELLRKGREHFLRVRSTDGAEGISVDNGRADILRPILNRLIIPKAVCALTPHPPQSKTLARQITGLCVTILLLIENRLLGRGEYQDTVEREVSHRESRSVLECGGWRGMGLTPLSTGCRRSMLDVQCSMFDVSPIPKAVCALTPHPPQSKTLARQITRSCVTRFFY